MNAGGQLGGVCVDACASLHFETYVRGMGL